MAELSITARDYAKAINFYKEGLTYDETYLPVRRKIQIYKMLKFRAKIKEWLVTYDSRQMIIWFALFWITSSFSSCR